MVLGKCNCVTNFLFALLIQERAGLCLKSSFLTGFWNHLSSLRGHMSFFTPRVWGYIQLGEWQYHGPCLKGLLWVMNVLQRNGYHLKPFDHGCNSPFGGSFWISGSFGGSLLDAQLYWWFDYGSVCRTCIHVPYFMHCTLWIGWKGTKCYRYNICSLKKSNNIQYVVAGPEEQLDNWMVTVQVLYLVPLLQGTELICRTFCYVLVEMYFCCLNYVFKLDFRTYLQ